MNIIMVASEAVPFVKSGGLADVMGALPKYLKKKNRKVSLILPLYGTIKKEYYKNMELVCELHVQMNWRSQRADVYRFEHHGLTFLFVENDYYFSRDGLYGHFDDGERFVFFSRAVAEYLLAVDERIDIVHTHDWQTALVNVYIDHLRSQGKLLDIKTVFTIHNLKYQGRFGKVVFDELLDLPPTYFTEDRLEYFGDVNFMKGAIIFADHITTVSPSYSYEIRTEYFGEGLDGVLRANEYKLSGVINGLDYSEYQPKTDVNLYCNYISSYQKKLVNKTALQEELGLEINKKIPMLSLISRFTEQKGLDLLVHIMDQLLYMPVQLVIHGNGDSEYEHAFSVMAGRYPDKCRVIFGFKEDLARKIYAGSDIFLMPSKFEPCGLSQMIALNYGTVPVVRETGGLQDTVQPFNEFSTEGNGFSFANFNAHELLDTIEYALELYQDQKVWKQIVKNALCSSFTWDDSAEEYLSIYRTLLGKRIDSDANNS